MKSPEYENSTKVPCYGVEGLQLKAVTEIKVLLRSDSTGVKGGKILIF